MPRPRPLQLSSGTPTSSGYQSLTPRTPHSRSGKAEEAFSEIELDDIQEHEVDEDYKSPQQQQSRPLLTSTNNAGYRSRGDDFDVNCSSKPWATRWSFATVVSNLPLVLGGLTAGLLLFLIFASYQRPETLHRIIGASIPSSEVTESPLKPQANLDLTSALPSPTTSNLEAIHTAETSIHNTSGLISYEGYTHFPLRPTEYLAECAQLNNGFMHHSGEFWDPPMHGPKDVEHHDVDEKICESTITYMLDGHVGLLADLALMAQIAALARERNRTFLVDDTYWDRGKWTDYFVDVRKTQPGVEPDCKPPPAKELVACPRTARHWVVNSRTAKFHLGHSFSETYEDAYGHGLHRLEPIFETARQSFVETIIPNEPSKRLIYTAQEEFSKLMASNAAPNARYVGVHVRRGDRKASSWKYHGKYLPISEYTHAVADTWERLNPVDTSGIPRSPFVYLASDSPSAIAEFVSSLHEENVFYLGQSQSAELRTLASPADYVQSEFDKLSLSERDAATRGIIVDFAMVSGMWSWNGGLAPDATICTISSSVCRMSAVALGWTQAFGQLDSMGSIDNVGKHWVEIDEKGQIMPVWQAFELFFR